MSELDILILIAILFVVLVENNAFSVIVVGAGASGIAAATRLLENYVNVTILEAENRIGGRVNSVKFGNAFVDLGAEWCHGEKNNIVYNLVKNLDILKSTRREFEMIYSNGTEIEYEFAKNVYNFVNSYEDLDRNNSDYYITIGDFFIKMYTKMVTKELKNDTEKQDIAVNTLDTLEKFICSFEGSFDWFKPVLNNAYESCPGDSNLHWNGHGYKTILEVMMKKYPDPSQALDLENKIYLGKAVTEIHSDYSDDQVHVECEDGSEYSANHVIFTPSVGVLRMRGDAIFEPTLSEKKQKCAKALGFDALMKVLAYFPEKFWQGVFIQRMFVWNPEDKAKLSSKLSQDSSQGPTARELSWIENIYHVLPTVNNPNVLTFWIAGDVVPEIETASNAEITHGIMIALDIFLGKEFNITKPDQIIHYPWYTNPHFHGIYSYETVESLKLGYNCHDELAKTVNNSRGQPMVFFAGEATHPKYFSTVHGAIETGYREADKILAYYNRI